MQITGAHTGSTNEKLGGGAWQSVHTSSEGLVRTDGWVPPPQFPGDPDAAGLSTIV